MKKAMRYEENKQYWDRRWVEAEKDANSFKDLNVYPVRFSEIVVKAKNEKVLELGCGLGRVLKHYHYNGFDITGVERSEIAVSKIKQEDGEVKIMAGDTEKLPFKDETFDVLLAFGLFQNIEENMVSAIEEALRCLKKGGSFCISMRPDNFEMRLNEWYWNTKNKIKGPKKFHKWLVREGEFKSLLNKLDCVVDEVHLSRNVSILWRIPFLQKKLKNETERRAQGYPLNWFGKRIYSLLVFLFPKSFCNILVFIGRKL